MMLVPRGQETLCGHHSALCVRTPLSKARQAGTHTLEDLMEGFNNGILGVEGSFHQDIRATLCNRPLPDV